MPRAIFEIDADESLITAVQAVVAERARQDARHGGAQFDDRLLAGEWLALIERQVARAEDAAVALDHVGMTRAYATAAGDEFRLSLTRLAALSVAALQAYERRAAPGAPPP
jgi:hypothetical protein